MSTVALTIEDPTHFTPKPVISLREIVASVQRMNPPAEPGSPTFEGAVLLQAGRHLGHNVDRLARFTGISRELVARCARRLVDNGVWSGGGTVSSWVSDPAAIDDFWADVAVAEGKLCRRVGEDGTVEWAPQGYWRKHYEYAAPKGVSPDVVCYHEHVDPVDQDYPYIVGEDHEEVVAPEPDEPLTERSTWMAELPAEPSSEPVWLGQSDAQAGEVPATVGGGAPTLFPEAVWLG